MIKTTKTLAALVKEYYTTEESADVFLARHGMKYHQFDKHLKALKKLGVKLPKKGRAFNTKIDYTKAAEELNKLFF